MGLEKGSWNPTRDTFHMIRANHGSRLLALGVGLGYYSLFLPTKVQITTYLCLRR